ncbi:hypothetical protein D7033_01395, partial [Aquimarina sp. AD10]
MNYLLELQEFVIIFQIITAIIGSIFFFKYKNATLKYFLIVLWYIAINDFTGFILKSQFNIDSVTILYNIYYLIVFNCYMS